MTSKHERVKLERIAEEKRGFILPIRSSSFCIWQGYDGPYSHFTRKTTWVSYGEVRESIRDDRYFIDFSVPVGTDVFAAKEGLVRGVIDSYNSYYQGFDLDIGFDFHSNFVALSHPDWTWSVYSHLEGASIRVNLGDRVRQGDLLGKTGLSGWIGPVPHLHFGVFHRPYNSDSVVRVTHPVCFENYHGQLYHELIGRTLLKDASHGSVLL